MPDTTRNKTKGNQYAKGTSVLPCLLSLYLEQLGKGINAVSSHRPMHKASRLLHSGISFSLKDEVTSFEALCLGPEGTILCNK